LDNDPYGGERNASRLKDLAERLLDHDYHADTDTDKPQLFLGELPSDLPADIPVPKGMVLLGGLRRVSPWRSEPDAQIILGAEAEPEGVYAAFREHMAGSEWSKKRRHRAECGGFVSTGSGVRSLTFCLSPRGPALLVCAYRRCEAGTTEVRPRLEGSRRDSPCSDDQDCYAYDERSVLPALFPPEGVAQISGGGGGRTRGISVEVGEEQAALDLTVNVLYGRPLHEVTDALRQNVIRRIESLTGLEVTEVNITVNDVTFPQQ
jgi:hypothetical protein